MKKGRVVAVLLMIVMVLAGATAFAEQAEVVQRIESTDEASSAGKTEKKAKDKKLKASVSVSILTSGNVHYGDTITLKATVKGLKGVKYALSWEVNDGSGWETVKGENSSKYSFKVTEKNVQYKWRAVATV